MGPSSGAQRVRRMGLARWVILRSTACIISVPGDALADALRQTDPGHKAQICPCPRDEEMVLPSYLAHAEPGDGRASLHPGDLADCLTRSGQAERKPVRNVD